MTEVIKRERRNRDYENNENLNCKCVSEPVPHSPEQIVEMLARAVISLDEHGILMQFYTPERILKSNNATVVFWGDGEKTVVKCNPETVPDDYSAFTAALAIRIYGNNSRLKKLLKEKTVIQEIKPKKVENTPPTCNGDWCDIEFKEGE